MFWAILPLLSALVLYWLEVHWVLMAAVAVPAVVFSSGWGWSVWFHKGRSSSFLQLIRLPLEIHVEFIEGILRFCLGIDFCVSDVISRIDMEVKQLKKSIFKLLNGNGSGLIFHDLPALM